MPDRKLEPWQHVESRTIWIHPRLTVIEDTVILPSGQQIEWLRYHEVSDFVGIICLDDDGRVLVARQYCHPPRRVMCEFPGGAVEEGESYADAARRELMEEVGLFPRQLREIGTFLANNRRSATRAHIFLATDLKPRSLPSDDAEFVAYEWLETSVLEEKIRLGEIDNGILLAAWCIFRSKGYSCSSSSTSRA